MNVRYRVHLSTQERAQLELATSKTKLQTLLGRGLKSGGGPVLLGLLWGLVPCGLVYMMLVKSLDAGSWRMGAAGMAAFGLGNLPVLLGLGLASTRLGQAWRHRLLRLGGLLVAGMGVYSLVQAVHLLRLQGRL